MTASEIYAAALARLNSGLVELLDVPRLLLQLASPERRVGGAGRETIDHPAGHHDDLAVAACGALVAAFRFRRLAVIDNGADVLGRDVIRRDIVERRSIVR